MELLAENSSTTSPLTIANKTFSPLIQDLLGSEYRACQDAKVSKIAGTCQVGICGTESLPFSRAAWLPPDGKGYFDRVTRGPKITERPQTSR